ncbi:MAG: HlyC/CorC family transporter [Gammaproteobacteria bacterium]
MVDSISTTVLLVTLVVLLGLSAFFSAAETALMAVNRYRLRHMAKKHHRGAILAERLLERPDRLLGTILIGNNFANIFASSITTIIALRYWHDLGLALATLALTITILIFGEVTPKTLAAFKANRLALMVSWPLVIMQKILYPMVWMVNVVSNWLLRLCGVEQTNAANEHLSMEELRTVVDEAAGRIPGRHKRMLLRILDLKEMTVEDIMVPRNEIVGIDLDDEWPVILKTLCESHHTRLPLYQEKIENITGMLHVRDVLDFLGTGLGNDGETCKTMLKKLSREVYYLPESTPLTTQLLNFQNKKERTGIVVDEYGDVLGLVAIEDILEEIVGEFTTDIASHAQEIHPQVDGSFWIDGSMSVRELNRELHWDLPTDGPKTLNGLILEYLEFMPSPGVSLKIKGYPMEVLETGEQKIKMVKIVPAAP